MADASFTAETLDDVLRLVFAEILRNGKRVVPTKGANREITGVILEVTNPIARLSLTETRGKPFSCLGELCWYLSGTNDVDFISHYIGLYREYDEDGKIFGGYGPRLFDWRGLTQLHNVIRILRARRESRQAVIQLFDGGDLVEAHKDVPCTCTLQFLIRDNKLQLLTHMRSNDAYVGLPHDFFCFTMLQEIVARDLGVELGTYKHMVGSLHIYEAKDDGPGGRNNLRDAEQFLREGFQSTKDVMPPMPLGDPWPGIKFLVDAEREIRTTGEFDDGNLVGIDSYWADLVRLLQLFRCKKHNDSAGINSIRQRIGKEFSLFIDRS